MSYQAHSVSRRVRRRGFTMVEVMISLMVFLMIIMIFAAVFPFALRTAEFSNDYAQAALLAQHKIDQLQTAGYARFDYNDLSGLGIIDAGSTNAPYTFTSVDNLAAGGTSQGFFPPGSTGTVNIVDYHSLSSGVPAGKLAYVTVKITWTSYTGNVGTYSTSAIL